MRLLPVLTILLAAVSPLAAVSTVYTVDTTLNGRPIKASANFTLGNGTVTVALSNLLVDPTDIAQVVSAIAFDVSGFDIASGATLASSSGQYITIDSDGSYTLGSTGPMGWAAGWNAVAGVVLMCDICDIIGVDGSWPANFLIGPPGSGGLYSNANSTIAGSHVYNPFLSQSATFVLQTPGVTSNSRITSVDFSLGPHFGIEATGDPRIPEPVSFLLVGSGLILAGSIGRFRPLRIGRS